MKLSFVSLDSFTTTRYAGNPVAIIQVPPTCKAALSQTQKQAIAREFNLSEIVFLHLPGSTSVVPANGSYPFNKVTIDIFTSHAEVPFAGHPTIGSAHYLLKILNLQTSTLITKAGPIPISVNPQTGFVQAEIPHKFHVHNITHACDLVAKGSQEASPSRSPVCSIVKGMSFIFVTLPDLATLALAHTHGNLNVNTYDPSSLDEGWQVGLVCTMYLVVQGTDEHGRKAYRTRMFGTREDPGTGSASSALACWLALQESDGEEKKTTFGFSFTQGVEMGKRNDISVEVVKGKVGEIEMVKLSGPAVQVMEGSLEID